MPKFQSSRDASLDLLKGGLVIGMVLDHVIKLLGRSDAHLLSYLTRFIDLVTFPSFLFVFGYTTQLAYFSKGLPVRKILLSCWNILLAFYVSGFGYEILVGTSRLSRSEAINILILRNVPAYSEFLVAFALTILVAAILFKPIELLTRSPVPFLVTVFFLWATTFIPYQEVTIPQLGLLIGSERFHAFPVLQYFPLFFMGIYCCQHKPPMGWLVAALVGVLGFVAYTVIVGDVKRFPPSLPWIIGSMACALIAFFVAQWGSTVAPLRKLLAPLGVNSLFYLVGSNLLIFALTGSAMGRGLGLASCVVATLLIVSTLFFLTTLVRPAKAT